MRTISVFMNVLRTSRHHFISSTSTSIRVETNIAESASAPSIKAASLAVISTIFNDPTSNKVLVITGAGLSTNSGIPDYRSPNGAYSKGHKPIVHDEFMKNEFKRKRYWGRSLFGFKVFAASQPNDGHKALTNLEKKGRIGGFADMSIITQNVDRLHTKSGTKHVVDLHGRGDRCVCMSCGKESSRLDFHLKMESQNSHFISQIKGGEVRKLQPDGDAELDSYSVDFNDVVVPPCSDCGGIIKTAVTFFGDNVPRPIVDSCYDAVDKATALLVCGSSLQVFSAFRFVKRAKALNIPIIILNKGPTRGDDLATLKSEHDLSLLLTQIDAQL